MKEGRKEIRRRNEEMKGRRVGSKLRKERMKEDKEGKKEGRRVDK